MAGKKRRYAPKEPIPGQRTIERRIMADLKEADLILGKYKIIAQRAANELAKLKSFYVFGRLGGYRGHLGCFEAGVNTICLHIQNKFMGKSYLEFERKTGNRPIDFVVEWSRRLYEAGIRNLGVDGHF